MRDKGLLLNFLRKAATSDEILSCGGCEGEGERTGYSQVGIGVAVHAPKEGRKALLCVYGYVVAFLRAKGGNCGCGRASQAAVRH